MIFSLTSVSSKYIIPVWCEWTFTILQERLAGDLYHAFFTMANKALFCFVLAGDAKSAKMTITFNLSL